MDQEKFDARRDQLLKNHPDLKPSSQPDLDFPEEFVSQAENRSYEEQQKIEKALLQEQGEETEYDSEQEVTL